MVFCTRKFGPAILATLLVTACNIPVANTGNGDLPPGFAVGARLALPGEDVTFACAHIADGRGCVLAELHGTWFRCEQRGEPRTNVLWMNARSLTHVSFCRP